MAGQSEKTEKVVRVATAAANIARGAAAGGLYGAAVEAVKSFWPEIVKLSIVLTLIIILGPMLVFLALPNVVFGYNSATDQDIVEFTDSAQNLDSLYEQVEAKAPSILERLVSAILPSFQLSDGTAQYDSYTVTEDLGNLNQYWLIAIGSVKYKQDLTVMDEKAVEELVYGKLTYTASLVDQVLNISIRDMTPEEYMNRLGFSEEEKEWAALLYSVMADEQFLSYGDSDGDGYYNTDYGDVTLEHRETPVVYYNESDA